MKNTIAAGHTSVIGLWNAAAEQISDWISHNILALAARAAVAAIFLFSARTKVDGLLTIKDTTFTLFAAPRGGARALRNGRVGLTWPAAKPCN